MIPFPLKRLRTNNPELNRVQDFTEASFRSLGLCPLLDGVLLEGLIIPGTPTAIAHGLGRIPRGYIVVFNDTGIYPACSERTDKFLTLTGGFASTYSLWIF